MDILRPGYQRVSNLPEADRIAALEKQAVVVSLENLMTFPFVRQAVEAEELTLHGLWTSMGEGSLEQYDAEHDRFVPV
jgi:carbonic anhydrase